MDRVRYGNIRGYAQRYCALCNSPVDEEEEVIANEEFLPIPWICSECARIVADLVRQRER